MEVLIKITENGYSKTVKRNDGSQFYQQWIRSDNGFKTTDDSIVFEDSDLLDETIEALSNDFNCSELCNALENEVAEIYNDGEDPITTDGYLLKRGETFYTVACTIKNKKWHYLCCRMSFPKDWGSHGSTSFISKEKCIAECDKRNLEK